MHGFCILQTQPNTSVASSAHRPNLISRTTASSSTARTKPASCKICWMGSSGSTFSVHPVRILKLTFWSSMVSSIRPARRAATTVKSRSTTESTPTSSRILLVRTFNFFFKSKLLNNNLICRVKPGHSGKIFDGGQARQTFQETAGRWWKEWAIFSSWWWFRKFPNLLLKF